MFWQALVTIQIWQHLFNTSILISFNQNSPEAMKNHNHNAGLMNRGDIAQSVHSQNTSDVLNKKYRQQYETEKTNYEFQKTLTDVPGKTASSRVV